MALIQCKECGNKVSTKAKTCPSCGSSVPKTSLGAIVGAGIIGVLLIGAMAGRTPSPSANQDKSPPPANAKIDCTDFTGIDSPHVQAARFDVQMGAAAQGEPQKPRVVGKTNLPTGTSLLVTLERKESSYQAQANATVAADGCFAAGPFTQGDAPINPGQYVIDVMMPVLQPDPVTAVIGSHGQNISGVLVHRVAHLGKVAEFKTLYSFGQADAAKDADSKQKAKEDSDKRQEESRTALVMLLARGLKENLRNPSSADWVSVLSNDDATVVCVVLRAQNGFGGMTVDDYAFVNGKGSTSTYLWNRHCAGKYLHDLTTMVRWTI